MIEVYFNNGNKAKFQESKVLFDRNGDAANRLDIYQSMAVVNWNQVCFVKHIESKEDEDE